MNSNISKVDTLLLFVLMGVWGINFSVIKLGLEEANPLILTALRFFFAVFPLVLVIKRPSVKLRYLVGYSLTFGLGVWGLVTCAIKIGISAGIASLILQSAFVFSCLLGYVFFKESVSSLRLVAIFLACCSIFFLTIIDDGSVPLPGVLLALAGAVFWALTSLIVKIAKPREVFSFSIWGVVFTPFVIGTLVLFFEGVTPFYEILDGFSGATWFSIVFQAYPVTVLGYWYWNKVQIKYPLSMTAPYLILVPTFSFIASIVFYNEAVTLEKIGVFTLVIFSLFVFQFENFIKARIKKICLSSS